MIKNSKKKILSQELIEISELACKYGYENINDYLKHAQSLLSKYKNPIIENKNIPNLELFHRTNFGTIYHGDSCNLMNTKLEKDSIDLIITSPPFGLVRKKDYGNEAADNYLPWFKKFAVEFHRILKNSGSLVIDIGGAWNKGMPTRSLYHFELLLMLCNEFGFHLIQEFFWWNPSKLPSPAEWVNVRRIRVKDAVNCIWWLGKTPYPKASNKRVLQPYSASMKDLLKNGYTAKLRPSGHDISENFKIDNLGSIPPNLLAIANTESNSAYHRYCKLNNIKEHPARFPIKLPAYFIRMLTDKNDMVLDPFAGSCATGAAAEALKRNWICCDLEKSYLEGSLGRFDNISDVLQTIESFDFSTYEISSPQLNIITEENSPLPSDGGQSRIKK